MFTSTPAIDYIVSYMYKLYLYNVCVNIILIYNNDLTILIIFGMYLNKGCVSSLITTLTSQAKLLFFLHNMLTCTNRNNEK